MSGSVTLVDVNNNPVGPSSPYVSNQTATSSSSGIVANATAQANLTGTATTTVFITGFEATAGGATAAGIANLVISGTLGGNLSYVFGAPLGAAVPAVPLTVEFNPPLPASAANTTIQVTLGALGTGNTKAAVTAHGFYQ